MATTSKNTNPAARRRTIAGVAVTAIVTSVGAGAMYWPTNAERAEPDPAVRLVVSLGNRKLYVREGDTVINTYPIAIGRGSMPTPAGTYFIRRIVWNPAWVPPDRAWARDKEPQAPGASANPMKVVKIFFREPDYYIHGTGDLESLGEAASHGCLRMDPDDAYAVARFVMEHGGEPRDESWFWRILHVRSETKTVYLSNPVQLTVEE